MSPSIRDDVQVLDAMLAGLDRAPAVYQAAPGWKTALDALTVVIRERGLATFRSWPEVSGFSSDVHPYMRVMIALRKYTVDKKVIDAIEMMQLLVVSNP